MGESQVIGPLGRSPSQAAWASLSTGGAALSGITLMAAPVNVSIAVIAALGILLVLLTRPQPGILVTLALLLQMSSATEYARASPEFSAAARGAAIVLCLFLLAGYDRYRQRGSALAAVWVCGTSAFLWVGAASGLSLEWVLGAVGLALTAVALGVVARHATPQAIGAALDGALIFTYSACYLSVLAGLSTPVEGGRLEGFFANANTLGFLASLGVVRFVISPDRRHRVYLVLVLAIPAVFWTGTRAAAAAFVAAIIAAALYSLLSKRRQGQRILGAVLVVSAISGAWLVQSVDTEVTLLRTNDSRADGVAYALSVAESTNGLGQGYENGVIEIASTPLRWLADGGYVGLSLVLTAYVVVLLSASRLGWKVVLVAVYGVAHSTLEGWYFSGGSALFFSYWLAFFSAAPFGGLHHQETNAATESDIRRAV